MWLFIIFVNEHHLETVVGKCSAKKMFLKFHKIYSKKPVPAACNFIYKETLNFIYKETLVQVFEFHETFKDTFFNRTSPVVASGLFF